MTSFTMAQQEIINQVNGPVLVIACPGSGKTTTMLGRTHHMVECGVLPRQILVVTFTRNAADEMKERFMKQYGRMGVTFCTIHHLCYAVIRKRWGFNIDNILKEYEQYSYFREYIKNKVDYNDREDFCKKIISEISYVKNSRKNPYAFESVCHIKNEAIDFGRFYDDYAAWKQKHNKVDFDDMLLQCLDILKDYPAELEYWQNAFPYIIIDEFQDTNIVQADIFYLLASRYKNICVVGDDDQSIYGFRSADSSIMLNFNKEFPDTVQFHLDTNYRSGRSIIDAASNLIENNVVRFSKDFVASRTDQGLVESHNFQTGTEMVNFLIENIRKLRSSGIPYEKMAVLYRVNRSAVPVIPLLENEDIPYHMKDSVPDIHHEFFFWDVRTYYKLTTDPETGDILKILNHPSRYLKRDDFANCQPTEKDFLDQADRLYGHGWNSADKKEKISRLFRLIRRLKGKSPEEFVRLLFNWEYDEWIEQQAAYMKRDVETVKASYQLVKEEAARFKDMEEWLRYADEYSAMLRRKAREKDGVTLSTFHGAKGLEWDSVFIIDANEGITPSKHAETREDMEEERRVFYVAATRAKNDLFILSSKTPSIFIKEMGIKNRKSKKDIA